MSFRLPPAYVKMQLWLPSPYGTVQTEQGSSQFTVVGSECNTAQSSMDTVVASECGRAKADCGKVCRQTILKWPFIKSLPLVCHGLLKSAKREYELGSGKN